MNLNVLDSALRVIRRDLPNSFIVVGDLMFTPEQLRSALDEHGTIENVMDAARRVKARVSAREMTDRAIEAGY